MAIFSRTRTSRYLYRTKGEWKGYLFCKCGTRYRISKLDSNKLICEGCNDIRLVETEHDKFMKMEERK